MTEQQGLPERQSESGFAEVEEREARVSTVTDKLKTLWMRFWMLFAGRNPFGQFAKRAAALAVPPYYGRLPLSYMNPKGYVSPKALIHHPALQLGKHVYIDDGVLIYLDSQGGAVTIDDYVHIHRDTIIQTGHAGSVAIGARTHIQPRCQLSAYKSSIVIGSEVEIAPYCAFYPYNHGVSPGEPIGRQPLQSKGGIVIEDGAWLGVRVVVLEGVRVGRGAVVGAGSVVTHDIPDNAIAAGVPAKVLKMRGA